MSHNVDLVVGWRLVDAPPENGSHCLVAQINDVYLCPPFYTYYLAIYDVWRGDNGRFTKGWWHEHTEKLLDNVTHWMPLPCPPNKEVSGGGTPSAGPTGYPHDGGQAE